MTDESNIPITKGSSGELSMDDALIQDIRIIVEENLKNDQFSVEDLAEAIALSRSHLHRKLQKLAGKSISQFIRSIRLEKATVLLINEVGTVSEIAYRVGFGSPTYFIKCFHEEYGYPPGEVKKNLPEESESVNQEKQVDPVVKESNSTFTPIESLNPATSEALIYELFEELVQFKPSLEKFLMVDEDEGEHVDIRLLAYQIIKNYPWPIGIELRRLFSGALKKADLERKSQLLKAIERNIKFLAYIMVSELACLIEANKMQLAAGLKLTIRNCIENPSPKNLIWLLQSLKEEIKKNKVEYFLPELKSALDKSLFREMEEWLSMIENKNNQTGDQNIKDECMSLEQMLILLLKKSAFLVKYKLVNIGSILVNKPKFKRANFEHSIHILNSTDSEFRVHHEVMKEFADSNALLIMKSLKNPKEFLNLSPLMIDTHNEKPALKSKIPIKKDIYFFNGFDGENLNYIGTEITQTTDLSQLPNNDQLNEEFNELITLISK